MLLLTHHLSLIFLRAWQKFIAEKEDEFNPTITFYIDYPVRNPNNNFKFEKNKIITLIFHNIFSYPH
jgi:hypothetical protein